MGTHSYASIPDSAGPRLTPDRLFDLGNYLFLIVFSVLMIYPFWETAVVSLLPGLLALCWGIKLWPQEATLESYRVAFSSRLIYYGYINTVFRTVVGTALAVFFSFFTAYPLVKRKLPLRNYVTIFFLIPMFFSGGLIPRYLLVHSLGMLDTRAALIFPILLGVRPATGARSPQMSASGEECPASSPR